MNVPASLQIEREEGYGRTHREKIGGPEVALLPLGVVLDVLAQCVEGDHRAEAMCDDGNRVAAGEIGFYLIDDHLMYLTAPVLRLINHYVAN